MERIRDVSSVNKKLREYPELWALCRDWAHSPEVKVVRPKALGFLEKPLCPSSDMRRVVPYVVTDWPSVEQVPQDRRGGVIVEPINRAVNLVFALRMHLTMCGGHTRYIFLHETGGGDAMGYRMRIIVVKPPVGRKNFAHYAHNLPKFVAA
jgi:hypothetical protein